MAIKKYEGVLERLGSGEYAQRGTALRYDVIVIGGQDIRGVATGGYVASFLDVGKPVTLYIGRFFMTKYIFAVKTESGLKKMSPMWFVGSGVIKLILTPLVIGFFSLFGPVGTILGFGLAGYLWYRFATALMAYNALDKSV